MNKKGWKIATITTAALLMVVLLRQCVATSYLIPSTGMENSLYMGERILVNKWSYGLRLPLMQWWGYHRWCTARAQKEDIVVFNNPGNLQQPLISRREVFIGRCIGTPGDTLLVDSLFQVAPSEQCSPDQKFVYAYPRTRQAQLDKLLAKLSINAGPLLGQDSTHHMRSFSRYEFYLIEQALADSCWLQPVTGDSTNRPLHPLIIPARNKAVRVHPWNITLLRNTLVLHEHRKADIRRDTLYIENKPVQSVTFCQDYYWIGANNSINIHDSRLFGLVPQSHLIGKAAWVWFSKEQNTGLFNGYRWERMGKAVR